MSVRNSVVGVPSRKERLWIVVWEASFPTAVAARLLRPIHAQPCSGGGWGSGGSSGAAMRGLGVSRAQPCGEGGWGSGGSSGAALQGGRQSGRAHLCDGRALSMLPRLSMVKATWCMHAHVPLWS